jgi:hypothetical protein
MRKETTVGYCPRESERRSISDVISAMKTKRKLPSETPCKRSDTQAVLLTEQL